MKEIIIIITLPVLAGLLLFLIPEKFRTFKGIFALVTSIIAGYLTLSIYGSISHSFSINELSSGAGFPFFGIDLLIDAGRYLFFRIDGLSKLIIVSVSLFSILIILYSIVYIKAGRLKNYYPYFLITLGCTYGAALFR